MSDTEGPVDQRVQPAIESLNIAIDALNVIEDTRTAAAAAASRAAAVVREELAELDRSHAGMNRRIESFLEARTTAANAIELARIADGAWRAANAEVSTAKDSLASMKKLPEQKPWLPQAKKVLEDLKRVTSQAKAEAKRAGRFAEERAVKLGEIGEGFERVGVDIPQALREHNEYRERRAGLEQVLELNEARLAQLEDEKEEATRHIGDAMGDLEALNEELQTAKTVSGPACLASPAAGSDAGLSTRALGDGISDGGGDDDDEDGGEAANCSPNGRKPSLGDWREDSMYRLSGDFRTPHKGDGDGDGDGDSFAGSGWSEEEDIDGGRGDAGDLTATEASSSDGTAGSAVDLASLSVASVSVKRHSDGDGGGTTRVTGPRASRVREIL